MGGVQPGGQFFPRTDLQPTQIVEFGQIGAHGVCFGLQSGRHIGQNHGRARRAQRARGVQQQQRAGIGLDPGQGGDQLRDAVLLCVQFKGQRGLADAGLPQGFAQGIKAGLVGVNGLA